VEREIIVRGHGEVRVLPDRALLNVRADGEAASRDDAYATAAKIATAVDAVFAAMQDAIGRVTATGVVVQPKSRWKKGEAVRTGWTAMRTSMVEVVNLDVLSDLVARLAAAGAAISGPFWQLDVANNAHADARRHAAEDARLRAEAYASALGLSLGEVAWVAEPGLRDHAGAVAFQGVMPMSAGARVAGGMAEEPTIDITPEEITIGADVEVGFAITAPS
jgi:uncharacterized protein